MALPMIAQHPFTEQTPLPALVTVRWQGEIRMAAVDKVNTYNGFLFARVRLSECAPQWMTATNIVQVVQS